MGLNVAHLPPAVAGQLRQFWRRKRLYALLRVAATAALLYGVLFLVIAHLDRFLFLSTSLRVAMSWGVHAVVSLTTIALLLRVALRRPSATSLAYELEQRLGVDIHERVVTLEDVLRPGSTRSDVAGQLARQLERSTVELAGGWKARRFVRDAALRRLVIAVAIIALACAALAAVPGYEFGLMVQRFVYPTRNLPKPSFVKIELTPAEIIIGKGGEAVIQARISGRIPAPLRWVLQKAGAISDHCLIRVGPDTPVEVLEMSRVQRDLFLYTRDRLDADLRYQVRYGDAQTDVRLLRVVAQPRITDLTATVTPPAYAGAQPQTQPVDGKPLRVLTGSTVRLSFRTDQAVTQRTIRSDRSPDAIDPQWDEATFSGWHELLVSESMSLEVVVVNALGFANVAPARVAIGIREDAAPVVQLQSPGAEVEAVSSETVPLTATAEDDLGLAELAISYVVNPNADTEVTPVEVMLPLDGKGQRSADIAAALDLERTGAGPGDVLAVRLRARDSAGNDGFSRQALVRVVPFTRGEHERRRIAALRWLSDAAAQLSTTRPTSQEAAADQAGIDKDAYDALLKRAAGLGVLVGPDPSVSSLLQLLEVEQHLTDGAVHKRDVRQIAGIVRWSSADAAAWRSLHKDVLPGLTHYRQARNLMWRLFGLRYEADNIARELANPVAGRSVDKRAKLYLVVLQDLGNDLIDLAQASGRIDVAQAKSIVGELNTTGYYITRGSAARRQASAKEMGVLLSKALNLMRPALVPLLDEETAARAKLDGLHARCAAEVVGSAGSSAETKSRAAEWLLADARLLGREPLTGLWPRLVNYAFSQALQDPGRKPSAALLLKPDLSLAAAIERERIVFDQLSMDWQLAQVERLQRVSEMEKATEAALIRIEAAARGALPRDDGDRWRQWLTSTDLSSDTPGTDWADALRPPSCAGAKAAMGGVAAVLDGSFIPPSGAQQLQDLQASLGAAAVSLKGVAEQVKAGREPAQGQQAAAVVALFDGQMRALGATIDGLALRLWLNPAGDTADADLALLKLREISDRHRSRGSGVVVNLRSIRPGMLSPESLAELAVAVDRLAVLEQALRQGVAKLIAGLSDGSLARSEAGQAGPLVKQLARTRRCAAAIQSLRAGGDDAAIARDFAQQFPEAGLSLIASRGAIANDAADAMAKAAAELTNPSPDAKKVDAALGQVRERLGQLRDVVKSAGDGDLQSRLASSINESLQRVGRLSAADAGGIELNRQRFEAGEVAKALSGLSVAVRSAAASREADLEYRGAVPGLASGRQAHDAEAARQRVLSQADHASRRAMEGILAPLQSAPDEEAFERGAAWSMQLYRLVRSDLAGGALDAPAGGPRKDGDSHLAFLRSELEKARQTKELKHYGRITKEYLDAAADFLRY